MEDSIVIGRSEEANLLLNSLTTNRSELIVVYGRRRIGKTYLIRNTFRKHIRIELTGLHKGGLKDQLKNFQLTLQHRTKKKAPLPKDWLEAFQQLIRYIEQDRTTRKKVIFLDEFPWLDSRRSRFLTSFSNFWNAYATKRKDLVVVICGSAASYMIQKIIKSKGGLHNRITQRISLLPFNLRETELMLKHQGVQLTRYDVVQLYMSLGGVPHYLEMVKPGESVAQAIDRLCFKKDAPLRAEFSYVFASLFEHSENHEIIVRVLSKVRQGMTRTHIMKKGQLPSGGTLSKTLEELEVSGFIHQYMPYKGIKDPLYRLSDEYALFYLKFIERSKPSRGAYWPKIQGQQSYRIWAGFTFETICMKHVEQVKFGLGIAGIHTEDASWLAKDADRGAQIDLLIDRDDNVISICEMKFMNATFSIDKAYAKKLQNKLALFQRETNSKKSLFLTMITSYGIKENQYSKQLVQNRLELDALFQEL